MDDPFFRILCVDDNAALLQTLALGFRAYGFEVVTASQGIDALMQFRANNGNFATILSDVDMPQMNGLEFIKQVRTLGYKGRVLVMSGRLSASECQAYQDLEVSGFLSKPFEISMVATLLLQAD
jgi:two-component system chemotaxis response regulator CheY